MPQSNKIPAPNQTRLQNINVGVELPRAGSVTKGATQFILNSLMLLNFSYQTVDNEVDGRV